MIRIYSSNKKLQKLNLEILKTSYGEGYFIEFFNFEEAILNFSKLNYFELIYSNLPYFQIYITKKTSILFEIYKDYDKYWIFNDYHNFKEWMLNNE